MRVVYTATLSCCFLGNLFSYYIIICKNFRKSPESELPPEERDNRTVMCMQLAAKVTHQELTDFFAKIGQVRDVKLIADKNSRRSKGIAYVEFYDEKSVPAVS